MPDPNSLKVDTKDLIPVYMAEYTSLRTEVIARLTAQTQAANHVLVMLGAVIAATVAMLNASMLGKEVEWIIVAAATFLPIGAVSLFSVFTEHDLMIRAIGSFIYYDRRERLRSLTGDDAILGSVFDFRHLARSTRFTHGRFGLIRHFLFYLPLGFSASLGIFWIHHFHIRAVWPPELYSTLAASLICATHFYATVRFISAFRWRREDAVEQERRFREHYLIRSLRNRVLLQEALNELAAFPTKPSEGVNRDGTLRKLLRLRRSRVVKWFLHKKWLTPKTAWLLLRRKTHSSFSGLHYKSERKTLCRHDLKLRAKLESEIHRIERHPKKRHWPRQVPVALLWTPDGRTGAPTDNENALWTRKLDTGNGEYFLVYRVLGDSIFLLQIKGPETR
jgi:hypothetical protein